MSAWACLIACVVANMAGLAVLNFGQGAGLSALATFVVGMALMWAFWALGVAAFLLRKRDYERWQREELQRIPSGANVRPNEEEKNG